MFALRDATASYDGRAVLSGITLRIAAGERVALIGRSGAGKSTLLSLLYRQGDDQCALIPQETGLVKTLSVFHNIYMGRLARYSTWYNLRNLVRPSRREIAAVRPIVETLGLEDKLFTPTGELSGGQRQRTAIGRALFQGSPAILGDEPVSAVDEHQARDVLAAIVGRHRTVVLAMHDVGLALAFTDRIIGLQDGRIVLDAASASLSRADLAPIYQG